ncbi:hypothetical protein LAUMK7_00499 [Mycobacterium kansasii]|nr:hypothetical protein MKANGN_49020 [Mycobacterium kansasii]VAZ64481.1 hypothetical protein LAUMK40_00598 [Mycobacterium kansasii]VAZ70773.1 hypothetical protein LAUMK7_00499 [Mycobacterium kansasii]
MQRKCDTVVDPRGRPMRLSAGDHLRARKAHALPHLKVTPCLPGIGVTGGAGGLSGQLCQLDQRRTDTVTTGPSNGIDWY